jgi:hypothetical protein
VFRATAHVRGCGLNTPPQPARQKLAKHQRTIRAWEAPQPPFCECARRR